jgi:hypothetical protein
VSFARNVATLLTWRRVAIAEIYTLVVLFREWLGLEAAERFGRYMAIETFSRITTALLVLLAIAIAEEAARRGARKVLSYAVAVLAASLMSALIFTSMWFDMAWRNERSVALFVLENTTEIALWASLALLVFYNNAQATRIREGVKQAQMNRVQIERGVLESRLAAARKQIDGPALFEELTEIRDALYGEDPQGAEALERLILRLRSVQASSPVQALKGAR